MTLVTPVSSGALTAARAWMRADAGAPADTESMPASGRRLQDAHSAADNPFNPASFARRGPRRPPAMTESSSPLDTKQSLRLKRFMLGSST